VHKKKAVSGREESVGKARASGIACAGAAINISEVFHSARKKLRRRENGDTTNPVWHFRRVAAPSDSGRERRVHPRFPRMGAGQTRTAPEE
jgi:hypothetical protein